MGCWYSGTFELYPKPKPRVVIPLQMGIQGKRITLYDIWVPAGAGMTSVWGEQPLNHPSVAIVDVESGQQLTDLLWLILHREVATFWKHMKV